MIQSTGSSIMPQKKNYDLFEIMRANGKVLVGYISEGSPLMNHSKGRPRIAGSRFLKGVCSKRDLDDDFLQENGFV